MRACFAQRLIPVLIATAAQGAFAAEAGSSLNLGIGGLNPMPHCDATIYTVEYEHRYSPRITILGRGSTVDYTSDDDDYLEDGTLKGVDIGFRYYSAGRMEGIYAGGSLGYWTGDWSFTRYRNTPAEREGDADSRSVRVNINLGYRYRFRDSNISIMPEVNLGKFFSSSSCDYTAPPSLVGASCDQDSDVDLYIFAGVNIGVGF